MTSHFGTCEPTEWYNGIFACSDFLAACIQPLDNTRTLLLKKIKTSMTTQTERIDLKRLLSNVTPFRLFLLHLRAAFKRHAICSKILVLQVNGLLTTYFWKSAVFLHAKKT